MTIVVCCIPCCCQMGSQGLSTWLIAVLGLSLCIWVRGPMLIWMSFAAQPCLQWWCGWGGRSRSYCLLGSSEAVKWLSTHLPWWWEQQDSAGGTSGFKQLSPEKSRAGLGPSPSMTSPARPLGPGSVAMTQLQVSSCSHVILACGSCETILWSLVTVLVGNKAGSLPLLMEWMSFALSQWHFTLSCSACQISWFNPALRICTGFNWVGLGTISELLEQVGGVSLSGLGNFMSMSPAHTKLAREPL